MASKDMMVSRSRSFSMVSSLVRDSHKASSRLISLLSLSSVLFLVDMVEVEGDEHEDKVRAVFPNAVFMVRSV